MAHFIYADELATLKHGYPLWEPDCGPDPEVSIADVGYIRYGQFCRLFNASLPKGHPANQVFGEPDGYEPIEIGRPQERASHPPGVLSSRSVSKRGADIGFSGSILEAGAGFHFESKKHRGAILIINSEANRKDTLRSGAFKDYIVKHYNSWLRLANNGRNARDISLSDLVFVTGRDNTADWAMATFDKGSLSGGVSFEAGYPALAGAQFSIWGSWKQSSSTHSHCGPKIPYTSPAISDSGFAEGAPKNVCAADLNKYNQCIFLRGFRIMERREHVRRKILLRVKDSSRGLEEVPKSWITRSSSSTFSSSSSLNREPSSSDGDNPSKKHSLMGDSTTTVDSSLVEIKAVSDYSQGRVPVEALLEYILESSDVQIAVAHDDDLADILQDDDEVDNLDVLIRTAAKPVFIDQGVGTLNEYHDTDEDTPGDPGNVIEGISNEAGKHENTSKKPDDIEVPGSRRWEDPGLLQRSPESSAQPFTISSPQATPRARPIDLYVEKQQLKQATLPPEYITQRQMSQPEQSASRTRRSKGPSKSKSAEYHEELEQIRVEIDLHQVRLSEVQAKISLTTKTGRAADRKNSLRSELDGLLDKQLAQKAARDTTSAELKTLQEEMRKKLKGVKRLPARTTDEVDAQIRTLETRIETGTMSLPEERAALRQISSLRRSRTTVESSQALQADIDAHRARSDKLQKQIHSESSNTTSRIDAVRAELDKLERDSNAAFAERGALYSERTHLQTRLSDLYEQRRQAMERYRAEREEDRRKVDEDRSRLAAKAREERAAQEERRRAQAQERLLERARVPAFAAEIRDCRRLLEYFAAGDKRDEATSSASSSIAEMTHQTRQPVDNHPGAGWVPMKKKKTEDSYFVGGKGKVKKGHRKDSTPTSTGSTKVSVPIGILSTLVSLSISPPAVVSDVPRTIAELREKIEWFEANQTRVTEENIARTEADLQRIYIPMRSLTVS